MATSLTYDVCGRIQQIVAAGTPTRYTYDQYGQLIREDNQALAKTYIYEYNDNAGNLTAVKAYNYTTGTVSGTPVTTSFGYTADKLTSLSGAAIAYNAMGCPTTYDGKVASWVKGKLSTLSKGSKTTGLESYGFAYNAYDQRVSKSYSYLPGTSGLESIYPGQLLNSSKQFYYDHSGRLVAETSTKNFKDTGAQNERVVFLYDGNTVIGMQHTVNGVTTPYYFHRNPLGDVIGIYNTSGALVAKYTYDAWGNCTISGNSAVANANPIRYRGYYYDEDTGLYYCNARYYSPMWRRFISPNDTSYPDPSSVNGLNQYCYCGNDPVNYQLTPFPPSDPIADSVLSGATGVGFMPIISPSGYGSSVFNSVLAKGQFRNGLFFGKGSVTGLYASGHCRAQISLKTGKFVIGAFGKFSLLNTTGQLGIGNDNFSVSIVGVGDIGTVSAMAGILIDPEKKTYFVGIEAKAAVFTARGGVQFEFYDAQIEVGGSVSALSAGFQFGAGVIDGVFYYKSGFAVLFGYDFYIRIKFA